MYLVESHTNLSSYDNIKCFFLMTWSNFYAWSKNSNIRLLFMLHCWHTDVMSLVSKAGTLLSEITINHRVKEAAHE